MRVFIQMLAGLVVLAISAQAADFDTDTVNTGEGELVITFVGHGTLMFSYGGMVIHVDPVGREADYSAMPGADLVLITHSHGDHLDPDAVAQIRGEDTEIIVNPASAEEIEGARVMSNGQSTEARGLHIEAVPAYNLVHKRDSGQPFHPKGEGNGYVIDFGGTRVYVAGDTENIPEMSELEGIDIAFLPVNLPYTMDADMAAEAARRISPAVLYPYHYSKSEVDALVKKLAADSAIEIRVRNM